MGLDQYIHRKPTGPVVCDRCNGTGIDPRWAPLNCDCTRGVEMAYFRKVNFLHKWVEDHLNEGRETNCEDIPFHLEAMAGLMQTCATVRVNPELGPELLPTMGRFFFGSTEYDEWYLKDVADVQNALIDILAYEKGRGEPGSGQYVYSSSW